MTKTLHPPQPLLSNDNNLVENLTTKLIILHRSIFCYKSSGETQGSKNVYRSATVFPTLTDEQLKDSWHSTFENQCIAQGLSEVLDPIYIPPDADAEAFFKSKQKFLYTVLCNKVLTVEGMFIVFSHSSTKDAQKAYQELKEHHAKSQMLPKGNDCSGGRNGVSCSKESKQTGDSRHEVLNEPVHVTQSCGQTKDFRCGVPKEPVHISQSFKRSCIWYG